MCSQAFLCAIRPGTRLSCIENRGPLTLFNLESRSVVKRVHFSDKVVVMCQAMFCFFLEKLAVWATFANSRPCGLLLQAVGHVGLR